MDGFSELMEKIKQTGRNYDLDKITQAYQLANDAHQGQMRASGEPYITHPIAVAAILVELGMDTDTIVAALLHDVVEDTDYTLEQLEKSYGKEVALLVDGVTKLGRIPFISREEQQAENVRKMLLAMAQDVRVIIIKLADRLHNMRTISYKSEEKQREKALETMEVYAPLAHRLGIRTIKEELEDRAIHILDPVAYQEIEDQLAMRREEQEAFLERIKQRIHDRLLQEKMDVQISARVKSVYGIYRKVYMQGRDFDEIYDIYACRVLVNSVFECYYVLGVIHDMFRPIPNRFKDYISTPKPNMYQSLHTTVIDKEGVPFEVQIRTWEMHYTAEYGVAAHWKYKAGISGKDSLEDRLAWVRQLLESQKESDDVEDLVKSIKTDIAPEEVFVFTPRGDVISLPTGSTVIDFAYAIHSAVGNRMVGAKVDGRIVSLDYKVKTGNIVEILTSKEKTNGPSRDWLNIVRTSEARNKIRSWFKKERREENIAQGKETVEKEFRRNMISLPEKELEEFITKIAQRQHFATADEFYAAIGYGGISLQRLLPRIKEEFVKNYRKPDQEKQAEKAAIKPKKEKASSGVIVEGLEGCLVKFARCCNPLPGDDIVGFVTRGYGVSIHKRDCVNVQNGMNSDDPEQAARWVNAQWAERFKETFKSTIEIYAEDRQNLIVDVGMAVSNMRLSIHSLNARELKDNHVDIQLTVSVADLDQLNYLLTNLRKLPGVLRVQRTGL
ncbi:MAG TPA: bifunctional (p)ppGpp synthetase/guanosine-3',5'-bis(diphosphate) 3'-pyrophosphohydrolase [Firmicutes bacterium]|nr:bifunctional (p)ppGpp synthetase/guanosine-3',5'-bis(diphosphate) 3'-pyrophosphohydrolase [Bacillota bacterium]